MPNDKQTVDMLLSTLRTSPQSNGLTHEQQVKVAEAAAPHLRIGNYDEALQKGKEQVLYGGFAMPFPSF